MELALVFCLVMFQTSAWTYPGTQVRRAPFCNGRPTPISMLPGPPMTGARLPLRSGGTREFPRIRFPSDGPLQFVIRDRVDFSDFWKRAWVPAIPDVGFPPMPEIDFSREMLAVVVIGIKPTYGYWIIIDGACEMGGHLDVLEEGAAMARSLSLVRPKT